MFIVGLSIMSYPIVSQVWNSYHATRTVAIYDEAVNEMSEKDYTEVFEKAEAYNKELYENSDYLYDPEKLEGYEDILNVHDSGIMGHITIDKINVSLPIYHGTTKAVLQVGAGHLEGTSFPIGGKNTHSVITAHCGLPSAKLFTDLEKLKVGDQFKITVLNKTLWYEVDNISIVEPTDIEELKIVDGKDYVTLLTCTPYGINSHRLLVRGHRIQKIEDNENTHEEENDNCMLIYILLLILSIVIIISLIIIKNKYRGSNNMKNKKEHLFHIKR